MKEARYAQTQGVTLLEQIVSAVGPIFSVAQAQAHAKSLRLTPVQVRLSLARLAQRGWIARLKRGSLDFSTSG